MAKQKPEPVLLARARARMAARLARFPQQAEARADDPPAKREAEVQTRARCAAIFRADVGRAARRVGEAANDLAAALGALTKAYPDAAAFRTAVTRAVKGAGLCLPRDANYYGADCFDELAHEAVVWDHMVHLMIDTMTDVWPDADDVDEEDEGAPEPDTVGAA